MTEEEYEEAESFWTKKDAEEKKMPEDELYAAIDAFLKKNKVLVLATGGKETIRCTPLEYSWHDGALWIFTEGGLKFRGLKADPHVAAAVYKEETGFGKLLGMQVFGTAEVVDLWSDEYKAEAAFRKIPEDALKKLPEPMWLLKIKPEEMVFLNSDFKKKGLGSRQTWKA